MQNVGIDVISAAAPAELETHDIFVFKPQFQLRENHSRLRCTYIVKAVVAKLSRRIKNHQVIRSKLPSHVINADGHCSWRWLEAAQGLPTTADDERLAAVSILESRQRPARR